MSPRKVVNMEYKFVRTIHGPAVVGEDEVVFLHERQVVDYVDSDSEFFVKAKAFISEAIKDYSNMITDSLEAPVVGVELALSLPAYVHASQTISRLEFEHHKHRSNPTV